ncbi:hypothetical protein Tco_0355938 [Tanacetum coccineum]
MHQEEHLDSDAETEIDDNTIPYHQYLLDTEAQNVPTEVSADTSDKVSMIAILTDLQTQLDGHAKVNQEKCLEIETLKNELLQCKQEICRLDTHKVKLDLENKVRQEQALVIQRNKRNAELVQENDLLKSTLSGKEKSIAFLQSEKEKILSEKEKLADSYLDEIVCLKTANKVARDMLQRFNMPTQTIPMLSKKPKKATNDLHKDILGTRNPGLGYMAKRAQPVLYDADTLLHPNHHPVSIWDSEDVLVHQVVSMKKMNEKPGHVRPANGFYDKLNALMFVPQKDLSGDQAYWLSANEIASQASKSATPATPFVHKSRFQRDPDYVSEWCYDYAKQFVEQQLVPFYEHFKKHIQSANETIFREVKEYEQIFDDLVWRCYERCVLDNKNLTIEKKNLLIKNDCLIAECLEKDICSIVLTSDIVVPPSSNCLCEDLRSACDREHTKVLELEAEVLKQQKMCIDTSSASNAIFEINKLRKQLQGKDDTIRNLDAQINIMKVLKVGSTEGSCDQQALDTDRTQLQDMITSLRIQLDGLKVENVSLKRRYDELSQANTHSRTAYTEKLSAFPAENTKLKAQLKTVLREPWNHVGPSYDSDIISEVQDHDNSLDSVGEYHEVHEMQNDVQPTYVVDSNAEYLSDSNIIPYDQYVKNTQSQLYKNKVFNESLTAKLARYKEQVEVYIKRAKFVLTEREQKIDEQMRIIIIDHNIKEETLKKELHSVKMQLSCTIDHNKLMKEEVATLKKDFKQKEKKYLEEFLDMKELKEKVEDKLYKQDQSLQTVYMLCKPKPYYDEKKKVAICYKNPSYLTSAMQVQSALYNGHEIVKTNHAPAVVHD